MTRLFILLLKGYKRFISPFLGNHCRFYPSCSDYAREALMEHGLFRGLFMALSRVARCHPLNPGGYDPVPKSCEVKK